MSIYLYPEKVLKDLYSLQNDISCYTISPSPTLQVVLGYPVCRITDLPEAQAALTRWYDSLDDYWDCDRHFLDREYEGQDFSPLVQVKKERVEEPHDITVARLSKYLRTWSAYRTWRERNPEAKDSVTVLEEEFEQILSTKEGKLGTASRHS